MSDNVALQDEFLTNFFSTVLASHFYLTGGTALARFYFHHRESLDLDLFTNNQEQDFNIANRVILQIAQTLRLTITSQVTTDTFLQYIFAGEGQVTLKVDMVKDIPIRFGEVTTHGNVRLDSIENIGSNKVLAVFGRTDAKDFIDLYWILHQTALTFDHLFQLAQQKDLGLSELYLAYSIQRVGHISQFPRMLQPLPWEAIVLYYQQIARTLLARIKPEE
jgi:predicted nucleotidyltransferase component of viral defense system